jgi:alkylhydroperoxidase family enzyme
MSVPATKGLVFDIAAHEAQVIGARPRIAPLDIEKVSIDGATPLRDIGKAVGRNAEPAQSHLPEAITTVMHHPSIFRHQMAPSVELAVGGTIPSRERELAVLRTTWLCRAPYAWGQHVENARHSAIKPEEVAHVTQGSSADGWSAHEAALLRAVEELLADQSICDQTWDTLAQTRNKQQLTELPVLVGLYFTFAMQHNSIRVGLPQGNKGLCER